jgi:hypothetical protein
MIQGMKLGPLMLACTALLAILYGVLFSATYPRVDISAGIVALCVLAALITCQLAAVCWNALRRARTATADPAPPAPPADTAARAPRRRNRKH